MAANTALMQAITDARLSHRDLAQRVRDAGKRLGSPNGCNASTVGRWVSGEAIPQPRMLACLEDALGAPLGALGFGGPAPAGSWLAPPGFPVAALCGFWVTAYTFPHEGQELHHADIAEVTVTAGRVQAVNEVARTEGRAVPFGNQISAELSGRHLIGHWVNTSDTRYYGLLHLAVLQGEAVMDGFYTGLATDVSVSTARWRWVRLAGGAGTIGEPGQVHELVMDHSQYDGPMAPERIAR